MLVLFGTATNISGDNFYPSLTSYLGGPGVRFAAALNVTGGPNITAIRVCLWQCASCFVASDIMYCSTGIEMLCFTLLARMKPHNLIYIFWYKDTS